MEDTPPYNGHPVGPSEPALRLRPPPEPYWASHKRQADLTPSEIESLQQDSVDAQVRYDYLRAKRA